MIDLDAFAADLHANAIQHEAGHASAALVLGLPVLDASCAPLLTPEELSDADASLELGIVHLESADPMATLVCTLAGPLAEGASDWPPPFGATPDPSSSDEKAVARYVAALELDDAGYREVIREARSLIASPTFTALHKSIADALTEPPHVLGAGRLRELHRKAVAAAMQHVTFKAAVAPTTDLGRFEAVISTEGEDREQDVVLASAMVEALSAWNRPIPLLWNHSGAAEDFVGTIDPASVHARDGEVIASGQVDLDSDRGREAWRSMKSRGVGFSFGYMITSGTDRPGGGRLISGLDVFEVSVTPTPMNNATRVLGTKAAPDPIAAEWRDRILTATGSKEAPRETLEEKAARVAAEVERTCTPVTVARFEC